MKSHIFDAKGIKFVYLTGNTPYEIGLNHGKLLKKEISLTIEGIRKFVDEKTEKPFNELMIKGVLLGTGLLKNKFSKDQMEEMGGIAVGSGQDLSWIIFANTIYEIGVSFSSLLKIGACSCFVSSLKNRQTIFGKTTDLSVPETLVRTFIEQRIVFVYEIPSIKYRFMTTAWPMCLAGDAVFMENGLSIAFNDGGVTYAQKADFKNDLILSIIRDLSEKCQTSEQILEELSKFKTVKPFICTVTDGTASGSFIAELNQGNFSKRNLSEYLITTNHFISEEMRDKSYRENCEKDKKYEGSLKRYQNMESLIKKGINNFSEAVEVLKIHEQTFDIDNGSVSNFSTVQGEIIIPSQKKIFFPAGNNTPVTFFGEWKEFSFGEIFNHGQNLFEKTKRLIAGCLRVIIVNTRKEK